MATFKIGQKVICIKSSANVKEGEMYTIKSFVQEGRGVTLFEATPTWAEGFHIWRFRAIKYENATTEILRKFKLTEEKADVEIKEYENA